MLKPQVSDWRYAVSEGRNSDSEGEEAAFSTQADWQPPNARYSVQQGHIHEPASFSGEMTTRAEATLRTPRAAAPGPIPARKPLVEDKAPPTMLADEPDEDEEPVFFTRAPPIDRTGTLLALIQKQKDHYAMLIQRYRKIQQDIAVQRKRQVKVQHQPKAALTKILGDAGGQRAQRDLNKIRRDELREAIGNYADTDTLFDDENTEVSCLAFRKFLRRLYRFGEHHFPMNGDVRSVNARYGAAISTYFRVYQWVTVMMFLLFAMFAYLNFYHLIYYTWQYQGFVGTLPRVMRYSTFASTDALTYTVSIVIFLVGFVLLYIRKVVAEDALGRETSFVSSSKDMAALRYGKVMFGLWDFDIYLQGEVEEQRNLVVNQIGALSLEETLAQRIADRTDEERSSLTIRRVVGTLITIGLILASWAGIIILLIFQTRITNWVNENASTYAGAADYIVPMSISIIGGISPQLVKMCTKFERWDHPQFAMKLSTVRLFVLNSLNVFIVVLSYSDLLMYQLLGLVSSDDTVTCKEDQVGEAFVVMMLTDFAVNKLMLIGSVLGKKVIGRIRKRPWLIHFELPDNVVGLIFSLVIILIACIFYPFTAFVAWFLMIISFKFDVFMLNKTMIRSSKNWDASDTGRFFMVFAGVTFALVAAVAYLFLIGYTHACGPHTDMTGIVPLYAYTSAITGMDTAYTILTNAWMLWAAIVLLMSQILMQTNARDAIDQVLLERQQRDQVDTQTFSNYVKHLRAKQQDLELQLEQVKRTQGV
eukprot:TRINITY_DN2675_c0_g2_i1.p1 TRINITY_DN2675_c0_g2~~TRINITY_DN2675_c0_g2_i1.p1  ORF type:complete len:762 (+),score=130.04 TRINITY_DN2675_c0_g2_i1:34-2319(+)